jgi:hypothetical protein
VVGEGGWLASGQLARCEFSLAMALMSEDLVIARFC